MDRRFFLSKTVKTAALLGAPFSSLKLMAENSPPYGAARLEDTDQDKFAVSILMQIYESGLPSPKFFLPFPTVDSLATSQVDDGIIIGLGPGYLGLDQIQSGFTRYFKNEAPCNDLVIKNKGRALHVFEALHETAHYVAHHITKDGTALEDSVYRAINKIPQNQETASYLNSLYQSRNNASWGDNALHHEKYKDNENRILVSEISYLGIGDRIADASAALYVLSNYGNTLETRNFLVDIIDFREARSYDPKHDTASSIRAVMKDFALHGRKGMSIVETTRLAANIIARQPEFNKSIAGMAEDIRNLQQKTRDYLGSSPGLHVFEPSYEAEKKKSGILKSIIDARNKACGIMPN